jgi:two-component system heavy metal sensor histidine kinase CusS
MSATRLDPRRWSLGLRLTVFFSLAAGATLCAVAYLLYNELTHQLWEKDEADIRRTMNVQRTIVRALDEDGGPDRWEKEWAEHAQLGDNVALRVIAPDGSVYSEPRPLGIAPDQFPPPKAKGALKRHKMRVGGRPVHYVLVASPIETRPGRIWVVQGAFDVTRSQHILEDFRRQLVLVMGLAIVASSAVGWLLVRQGLSPLRAMSGEIAGIDAERLHARIGQRPWPSDLRVLAESFDAMLDRLEAAFVQLSRFSSDLAHEFRSPITNLVAAASVMLSRERSVAEYQDTLGVIVEEGDRLSRMVSSMLFLARADNAKQALHKEPLSALQQLTKVAEVYEALAEERGVRIAVEGDATVLADPMLFVRALSNLVANALNHTPPGGTITLAASSRPEGAEIVVADTGSGIEPQHLPHIFDRFYRADAARSSNESTGLGLAVVKSIAELHGGQVRVQSEVGKGSRFTLWWPPATSR